MAREVRPYVVMLVRHRPSTYCPAASSDLRSVIYGVCAHFVRSRWYAMDSETARALAEEIAKGNQGAKIIRQINDHRDEINVHAEVGLNRTFEHVAATVWHE